MDSHQSNIVYEVILVPKGPASLAKTNKPESRISQKIVLVSEAELL